MGCPWGVVRLAAITLGYLAIGIIFYMSAEEKDCEDSDAVAGCTESWTFIDALYFSVVTISTVGYGDMTPSTDGSKAFTIIYIFFGITVVFSEVANASSGGLATIEEWFLMMVDHWDRTEIGVSGRARGLSGKTLDLNGDGHTDFISPPGVAVFWTQRLAPWLVVAIAAQFVSAAIFCSVESAMTYGDAFYHSFVTATTVGYGDIALTTQGSRLFAVFHIIFSVTFFAALVGRVQELSACRKDELQRVKVLSTKLDTHWMKSIITEMDQGKDGVNQTEFVVGMLIKFGVQLCGQPLEWTDIKPIVVQFDKAIAEFDKTGDGLLSFDDLNLLTENRNARLLRSKSMKCQHNSELPPPKPQEAIDACPPPLGGTIAWEEAPVIS